MLRTAWTSIPHRWQPGPAPGTAVLPSFHRHHCGRNRRQGRKAPRPARTWRALLLAGRVTDGDGSVSSPSSPWVDDSVPSIRPLGVGAVCVSSRPEEHVQCSAAPDYLHCLSSSFGVRVWVWIKCRQTENMVGTTLAVTVSEVSHGILA